METIILYFNGVRGNGAYVQNAMIEIRKDYTMLELVEAMTRNDYKAFQLPSMKKLVYI